MSAEVTLQSHPPRGVEPVPAPEPELSQSRTRHRAVALCSLAAAGIHFAAVGDHLQAYLPHGLFFIVVAWAQALWAVAVVLSPRRSLLWWGLAGNLAVALLWLVTRTIGAPIAPVPWTPEAVGAADAMATLLELAVVVGCASALRQRGAEPAAAPRWDPALGLGLSLAVLSGAAIGLGGGHAHEGGGHADGHSAGHVSVVAPGVLNSDQIDLVRTAMAQYEDVDAAFADGWQTEHEDWPEVGSHFYRDGDWAGPFPARPGIDLLDPEFLMYSALRTGEWELVAVAYVADLTVYPSPPAELSGAEYHQHVWTCVVDGEELEEDEHGPISADDCAAFGGAWSPGGVWMTHVWFIDNPNGVFAETNPDLVPPS